MSIDVWVLGCAGVDDGDLRVRTWWYGGETLPGTCLMFEPAEGAILALSPS